MGVGAVELTLNLGVLASRPLQQANPDASHARLPAPSQHPLPPRARRRAEGPAPPACCGPPSGNPGARLAHTPSLSGYQAASHLPASVSGRTQWPRPWRCGDLEPRAMVRLALSKARVTAAPKAAGLPPAGLLAREAEPTAPRARAVRR